jgi:hypothetical protein
MPPKRKELPAKQRDILVSALRSNWNLTGSEVVSDDNFPGMTAASLGAHLKYLRMELSKKGKGFFFYYYLFYPRFASLWSVEQNEVFGKHTHTHS